MEDSWCIKDEDLMWVHHSVNTMSFTDQATFSGWINRWRSGFSFANCKGSDLSDTEEDVPLDDDEDA